MSDVRVDKLKKVRIYRGSYQIRSIIKLAKKYRMNIIGGYVRWMASPLPKPVPADDIDLFPIDEDGGEDLVKYLEKKKFELLIETDNAWTFKRHEKPPYNRWPKLQIIKGFREGATVTYGTLEEVVSNFDFSVVRIGLIDESFALADPDFKKDEKNKRLKWKNIHCPISAVTRACKYSKKGYFVSPMEILRVFDDWDDRELDYKAELRELFIKSSNDEEFTEEQTHRLERMLRLD